MTNARVNVKVHQLTCHICSEKFASLGDLFNHFNSSRHSSSTPPPSYYNQPQYFFPTYENDNLLCTISCGVDDDNIVDDADDNPDKEQLVKPEDMPLPAISDIITMKKLLES
ncbi:hypothetical protein HELRODRAFT_162574 [Helobdella robusta]|uniref:C2H2-type domain-containing protein n=1 Tax=Helobdella robusta TaxID=6412 RepID=T1ESU9_HELRO|nr:hypothetical protein HELRODRAFT_162574 [Helobdella robusta]ESN99087.1 hypothetical protein HELRODRAFT_162574 [Helobdella robusta]